MDNCFVMKTDEETALNMSTALDFIQFECSDH